MTVARSGETHHSGIATPETFEVVKGALFRAEEMDNDVAEIEQHPPGIWFTLAPSNLYASLLQLVINSIDQGPHLAHTAGRGDHKAIGEGGDRTDINDGDIDRLAL